MVRLNNRYEILKELGGGGFAVTYQAQDLMQPSKPPCVVKQLRPNQASDPRVVNFFNKEAAILETLGTHPQIPRLLAHFSENNAFYIVQEFISGQDLSQEIRVGRPMGEAYVLQLLQDVLEILEFVHGANVVHRDIKPDNLMRRTSDGKLVLIDFGAVKQLGSLQINAGGQVTSTVVIGTPGYMPWEQVNGRPTFSSDIYALGVTAIQALTGISPENLQEDPQTGELIWPNAQGSSMLAGLLSKMVRHFPGQRYATAKDALEALRQVVADGAGTTPVPLSPTQPSPPRPSVQPTLAVSPRGNPPPPTQSLGAPPPVTRRNWLQWVRWLMTLETPADDSPEEVSLEEFTFDSVQVDERGDIIDTRSGSASFFREDLGNGVGLDMVAIPAGAFVMGSPPEELERSDNEGPQRTVTVPAFLMGRFAVTQAQYQQIMGKNPSRFSGNGANRPVESVSWNDAVAFCKKLSQWTGRTYRLPSEAEWEYACRAGTTTPFYFGPTITTDLANYYNGDYTYGNGPKGISREETTAVGSFPPNAFGLHDMHGNVWEWCADHWHKNYEGAPTDGSAWIKGGGAGYRMLRGGAWYYSPRYCRSACRDVSYPGDRFSNIGLRVVCEARGL